MRILYLHNIDISSEQANLIQVFSMCKAFSQLGNEVILSIPGYEVSPNKKIINQDGFKILLRKQNPYLGKFNKYLCNFQIRRVIKNIKPDLLYLRSPLLLSQTINSQLPIIMELHNNKLHLGYKILDNHWEKLIKKCVRDKSIKLIVCISKALTEYWIQKGIPRKSIITEHDGIDIEKFTNDIGKQKAREMLGISSQKSVITYLGRLYEDRRIDDIIALAKSFKDTSFYVVGGPNDQAKKYHTLAIEDGIDNISFIGQIPHKDTPKYLFASDILLALWSKDVPTINFCSPLKVFEYMASGRTIVAYGFPTIREVLNNKKNALLVEPESIEELKNAVDYALKEDVSFLGRNARNDVFENYSWIDRAKRILENIKCE